MRDALSVVNHALYEVDVIHRMIQVATTPEEIKPLVMELQEKFLSARAIIEQTRSLAESGDFLAQQALESEIEYKLNQTRVESEKTLARIFQVMGSAIEFKSLGLDDLPRA